MLLMAVTFIGVGIAVTVMSLLIPSGLTISRRVVGLIQLGCMLGGGALFVSSYSRPSEDGVETPNIREAMREWEQRNEEKRLLSSYIAIAKKKYSPSLETWLKQRDAERLDLGGEDASAKPLGTDPSDIYPSWVLTSGPTRASDDAMRAAAQKITKDSLSEMDVVGQAIQGLQNADANIIAPKEMRVDETNRVTVRLGVGLAGEVLRLGDSVDLQQHSLVVKASYEMKAGLTGPSFLVQPVSSERQRVVRGVPTEWSWDITAKAKGRQSFTVAFYVVLKLKSGEVEKLYVSKQQDIVVAVAPQSWTEWMKSMTESLNAASGMVTAFAALLGVIAGVAIKQIGGGLVWAFSSISSLLPSFWRKSSGSGS